LTQVADRRSANRQDRMASTAKRTRISPTVALLLVASACWAQPESHDRFLAFEVGMSKRDAFAAALESQRAGRITNLEVIGDVDKTYADKYRGAPIGVDDFDRVAPSDEWHVGLPECNCWVRLHFAGNRLERIISHEWTGPTE
jgi:hypothetical protein